MYDILLQDSYTEWVVPLTLAITWILSLKLFFLAHPVYSNTKTDNEWQTAIIIEPRMVKDIPIRSDLLLIKTVKRKECPDDPEAPHHSI